MTLASVSAATTSNACRWAGSLRSILGQAGAAIPARSAPRRAERLWERTCFEAFVAAGAGSRYYELNFSPSTEWAAYAFDGSREGLRRLALEAPPSIASGPVTGIGEAALDLLGRARKWVKGMGPAEPAEPQPFRVSCPEGHVIRGRRTEGYQALRCPECGAGVFVLPRSPLPMPPAPAVRAEAEAALVERVVHARS